MSNSSSDRLSKKQLDEARRQIAKEEALKAARRQVLTEQWEQRRNEYWKAAKADFLEIRRPVVVGILCALIPLLLFTQWREYRIAACKQEQFLLGAAEFNKLPDWSRRFLDEREFLQRIPNATQDERNYASFGVPGGKFWIFNMYSFFYNSDYEILQRASSVASDLMVQGGIIDRDGIWTPGVPTSGQLDRFAFACKSASLWGSPILPDGYAGEKVFLPWPTPDFDLP